MAAALKSRELRPTTPGAEDAAARTTIVRIFNEDDLRHVRHVTDRLLNNFKLAGGMAGGIHAESAFVIQPTPMYEYDLSRHHYPVPAWHQYTRIGYPVLRKHLDAGVEENVIWCADIQKDVPRTVELYVDPVHYSAAFNKIIAQCVVAGLQRSKVLERLARKKR